MLKRMRSDELERFRAVQRIAYDAVLEVEQTLAEGHTDREARGHITGLVDQDGVRWLDDDLPHVRRHRRRLEAVAQ